MNEAWLSECGSGPPGRDRELADTPVAFPEAGSHTTCPSSGTKRLGIPGLSYQRDWDQPLVRIGGFPSICGAS